MPDGAGGGEGWWSMFAQLSVSCACHGHPHASLSCMLSGLSANMCRPSDCPPQDQLLAGVCAESVVGALLWAQRFVDAGNGAFAGLLAGLKAWYGQHRADVEEAQPEGVKRLMLENAELAFELWRLKRGRSASHGSR